MDRKMPTTKDELEKKAINSNNNTAKMHQVSVPPEEEK
jgi:hypothetical protein